MAQAQHLISVVYNYKYQLQLMGLQTNGHENKSWPQTKKMVTMFLTAQCFDQINCG